MLSPRPRSHSKVHRSRSWLTTSFGDNIFENDYRGDESQSAPTGPNNQSNPGGDSGETQRSYGGWATVREAIRGGRNSPESPLQSRGLLRSQRHACRSP